MGLPFSGTPTQDALLRMPFSESHIQEALDNREIGEVASVVGDLNDVVCAGLEASYGIVEANEGAQPRSRPEGESSSTIGSESGGCQQARNRG